MLRLAPCADPKLPGADGIWESAKQSVDVMLATSDRDRVHRQAAAEALGRDSFEVREGPDESALPTFVSNFYAGSRTAIRIRADRLDPIIEKWALGMHSHVWKEAASVDAEITVFHLSESKAREAFQGAEGSWKTIDRGPGIKIRYLAEHVGNERSTFYEFTIWGILVTHVLILETLNRCSATQ